MEDKTGGPAFPFGQISEMTGQPINGFYAPGMTLRDYFAAKAMQAMIEKLSVDIHTYGDEWPTFAAQSAYQYADAMLKERAK